MLQVESSETSDAQALARAAAVLRKAAWSRCRRKLCTACAANALNAPAVEAIFAAKQRPAENPVIVHVADEFMARDCVTEWPATAQALAAALVSPLDAGIAQGRRDSRDRYSRRRLHGGRAVATASVYAGINPHLPLSARGAQREFINHISPTTAAHVQTQLAGRIPLVIDGGAARVGIESTVIDLTGETIRILRPGMVSAGRDCRRAARAHRDGRPRRGRAEKPRSTPSATTRPTRACL